MRSSHIVYYFILFAIILILASCGSGGGSGANDTNQGVYNFKLPPVGTTLTYASRIVNGNYSTNYTYTRSTSNINTDGSYTSTCTYYQDGTSMIVAELHDAAGNLLGETATPPNPATTFTYTPKVAYFPYPLFVGKTWNSNWTQVGTYGPVASFDLTNGVVIGTENITVPAGTFKTVKVQYNTTATLINITIPSLNQSPNVLAPPTIIVIPTSTTATCWLATDASIIVKCKYDYVYDSSIYTNLGTYGTRAEQLQSIQ